MRSVHKWMPGCAGTLYPLTVALWSTQDDEAELLAELERIKAERAEEAAKLAAERAAEEEKKVRRAACSAVSVHCWSTRLQSAEESVIHAACVFSNTSKPMVRKIVWPSV